MKNKKRFRITKAELEQARIEILANNTGEKPEQPKPKTERKYNDFWYGLRV